MTQLRIAGAGIGYPGYHQIANFLSHYLTEQQPDLVCWLDYHRTATWFRHGVDLLRDGDAELCLVNMRGVCAMAMRGRGLFSTPFPSLRGLATFEHPDCNIFAVDPSFGIRSFAELKQRKCPIRLTTGYLDGDNVVGFLAREILERHGIALSDIVDWGGHIHATDIDTCWRELDDGTANAVFQEATGNAFFPHGTGTQRWIDTFTRRNLVSLTMEPHVLDGLQRDFGWDAIDIPAGTYPNQNEMMRATEASGWVLCAREDLDPDIAYRVAAIICDHAGELNQPRLHAFPGLVIHGPQPASRLPDIADTRPATLHPGAARLYRERGIF